MNMRSGGRTTKKPGASLSPKTLREFAEYYPIARACINFLTTSITKLEWDIGSAEGDDIDPNPSQVKEIKEFFKSPAGHKTRLRELLTIIVDDVLTLDAISLYKRKTYGNDLLHLVPIDPGTIKLRVNDFGGTPEPPEIAYEQWIRGEKTVEMTTDELIYEMLSPRSYNAYGRAPLESLIVEVESALSGALYNLKYLEEGNDPEGFGVLPEGWTRDQIQEWQSYWDAMMTGNLGLRRRMKWVPAGFDFKASKKPDDMAFEKFEKWLLEKTCSIFGVPPEEIGFTFNINRATGEVQKEAGKNRGLYPIANFIKEIFDDIIQNDLGYPDLGWLWTNIDPIDEEREARVFKTLVDMGARSVDEYRTEKGLDPIGLDHYIMVPGKGPVSVKDYLGGDSPLLNPVTPGNDEKEEEQKEDLKRWQKCWINDIKQDKPLRKFTSNKINPEIMESIEKYAGEITETWQVNKLFAPFFTQEADIVGRVAQLQNDIKEIINQKS